ncbi:hypothetical protein [Acinetobacter nematophilus]|uniref:Uncharacterized protein n=1 Tax=Acinetobacter nematophilus TaxID=2994642 RepID=A0A9X3DWZ3_9GAMM|nr:hypothetical protein [Acinetobacter nematophilus]
MKNNRKISRLVLARHKDNLDKSIAVQLKYRLNKKIWISDKIIQIEINCVNGLTQYKILSIQHDGLKIIFLYGSVPYIVDLRPV